jgi:hypothetical protein
MNNLNLTTEVKKSNSLVHRIDINNQKNNCIIKIKLNDECKNGHQDFSITATFWEINKVRNDRNMIMGGCCHDQILKVQPNLKMFVNLHLCDYNGAPMYPEANGFYHLINGFNNTKPQDPNFLTEYCDYYRISAEQFAELSKTKEQDYFGYLLHKLGILDQWKEEAKKALIELEKLTNTTFVNDSTKQNYKFTAEQIKEIAEKEKNGFYSVENIEQRESKKIADKKAKLLQDLKDNFDKKYNEALMDYEIDKILIELFNTKDNVIFYNHTNKCVVNWQNNSYTKKYTLTEFKQFIDIAKKNTLLKHIEFELK